MEHYDYFVRITRPYSDLSGLVTIWAARASQMVVYEHIGNKTEKTHIHMVIKGSDVCKKQLKNLVKYLNFKGNKDWSFKDYDNDETAIVYMTKGKIQPSYVKGYTPEELQTYESLWTDEEPKITRQAALYDKFIDKFDEELKQYINEVQQRNARKINELGAKPEDLERIYECEFKYIMRRAKRVAFEEADQFWTMKCANDYKMLVYTYIMRNRITIPASFKDWAKFM